MEASSIKYQPKFGRVLIKREIKKQSNGGIIIPDIAAKRNAPCIGTIVALGETAGWCETYNENKESVRIQTLKLGDKVVFGRHSGAWLDQGYLETGKESGDESLFICQDNDILAVIGG